MSIWENIKYEVWWVAHVAPRLRFCKGRWYCLRPVAAYPMVRPTVCRKHRAQDLRRWFDEHGHEIPLVPWPPEDEQTRIADGDDEPPALEAS